jgi:mono/diheme cytochrome c family protein
MTESEREDGLATSGPPRRPKKKNIALRVGIGVVGVLVFAATSALAYVNLTYKRDFSAVPLPAIKANQDPAVIARGSYIVNAVAHCSVCHGNGASTNKLELPADPKDLRGGYVLKAGPFGTFYSANLTSDPETGIGKMSDAELARVIRHGVGPNGGYDPLMAFAVGPMSDEDLTGVVSYLRTLPPIKSAVPHDEWGLLAKALAGRFGPRMSRAPAYVPPSDEPSVGRGEYLANGPALCFGCHTPTDPTAGFAETGSRFSGAAEPEPDKLDEKFEFFAPNLTPDPGTGALGSYDEAAFLNRVRNVGAIARGTVMPWDNFKQMTDSDLKSIFRYLRSLPPTKRSTGPTRRPRGWKPDKG